MSRLELLFGLLVVGAVGFAILLWNHPTRAWIQAHAFGVVTGVALSAGSRRRRPRCAAGCGGAACRRGAATLMILALTLVAAATSGVVFFFPIEWQLVAVRSIVLVILVITPMVMRWLFLAAQRANLLNELLAHLQRLGLLGGTGTSQHPESSNARATRISSYLQRFEATYGPLPDDIYLEVLSNDFRPYTGRGPGRRFTRAGSYLLARRDVHLDLAAELRARAAGRRSSPLQKLPGSYQFGRRVGRQQAHRLVASAATTSAQ